MHQKSDICLCWYFLDKSFKYEPYLCSGSHDLMQKAINFNDVSIVLVKGSDYRICFWYMSKNDAINIVENFNLNEKSGSLIFFIMYKKWVKQFIKKNRNVLLNRAKYYYKDDKERLRDNARDKYRNLSEEEKNKKREYGRNKYHKMSKEKKQNLKEYQKNYCGAKKSQFNGQ